MNTTQRKYAIARLQALAKEKYYQLKNKDSELITEYRDLVEVDIVDILACPTKEGKVSPNSNISSVFHTESLKKIVENKKKAFHAGPYKEETFSLPWEENWRSKTIHFDSIKKEISVLLNQLQDASDTIMLGDADAAVEAIKSFEKAIA